MGGEDERSRRSKRLRTRARGLDKGEERAENGGRYAIKEFNQAVRITGPLYEALPNKLTPKISFHLPLGAPNNLRRTASSFSLARPLQAIVLAGVPA